VLSSLLFRPVGRCHANLVSAGPRLFQVIHYEIPINQMGGVRSKTPPPRLFISHAARNQCS
jgi:hypothetical protein